MQRADRTSNWFSRKLKERGRRALARQLDYQEKKAAAFVSGEDELVRSNFFRSQQVRRKLETLAPFTPVTKILEVGSGAHGLVFGIAGSVAIGVDPLAVDYKRLFPKLQAKAHTVAAIGEQLPFGDASFDIVMSDNVIDHAERPLVIVNEIVRVLKPGGSLYFTVNVHHPIYEIASKMHGMWNALGIKFELSPFADHTIHLSENHIADVFAKLPLRIVEQHSTVEATKAAHKASPANNLDVLLKKLFFKNALFELLAIRL